MIKKLKGYELTKDVSTYLKNSLIFVLFLKKCYILCVVMVIVSFFMLLEGKEIHTYFFSFLFIGFFAFLQKRERDEEIIKSINNSMNHANAKQISIILNSDNNFLVISDEKNINKEYKWFTIKSIRNFKFHIIIFISEYNTIIIPKQIFKGEQEMNEV